MAAAAGRGYDAVITRGVRMIRRRVAFVTGLAALVARAEAQTPDSAASWAPRLTRVSEDVINYSATITDPKVYETSWTVALPLNRDPSCTMFEYACHEGNLALPNALRAGRVRERAAAPAR
jgi:hypothetical protein